MNPTPIDPATIPFPEGPPPRQRTLGELRAAVQPLRLARYSPALAQAPRGDGRTVILVPGYKASDLSMLPLRAYLRSLGHDARGWGLGTNQGDPETDRMRLLTQIQGAVAQSGRPVSLVAWSLGGIISREAARLQPELVHHIVTYGSPIIGGPTHTVNAPYAGEAECRRIAEMQQRFDEERPLPMPTTVIFSRRDGIVSWQACIDHYTAQARHVEVHSTHVGMGVDPDVWLACARALAA